MGPGKAIPLEPPSLASSRQGERGGGEGVASIPWVNLSEAQAAVALLAKALPIMPSIQDPEAFKGIMAEFLARYPADVLVRAVHHIVFDGWSSGVFERELRALYAAGRRGAPDPLPPLPLQYADYAIWQRGWLTGPRVAPLLEKIAGPLVRDLLFLAPHSIVQRTETNIASAREGEVQTLRLTIVGHERPARPSAQWSASFSRLACW